MGRAVRNIKKRWLIFVTPNERGGRFTVPINVVHLWLDRLHLLLTAIQLDIRRKTTSALLRIYASETVVCDLRRWAKLPFAKLRSDVPDLLQTLDNRMFSVEASQRIFIRFNAESRLKFPTINPARDGTHCGAVL